MTRLAVAIERALERLVPLVKLVADESARLRLRLLVGTSVLIGLLALPYVGIYALGFGAVYSPIALALVVLVAAVAVVGYPLIIIFGIAGTAAFLSGLVALTAADLFFAKGK